MSGGERQGESNQGHQGQREQMRGLKQDERFSVMQRDLRGAGGRGSDRGDADAIAGAPRIDPATLQRPMPVRPIAVLIAMLITALLTLPGCAAQVTVPTPGSDHRPVLLLDHGRHSSLVLTRADGSLVRYAYGDWRWYAKRETGALRALPTLFVPTAGALGRGTLAGPPTPAALRRQWPDDQLEILAVSAPAIRIDALVARLERVFADAEQRHFNRRFGLEFVPDPRDYTLADNSNHRVADWLRELGLEVRGNPVFGHWRLVPRAGAAS